MLSLVHLQPPVLPKSAVQSQQQGLLCTSTPADQLTPCLCAESCAAWQVCKVYLGSFNAGVPIRSDLNPAGQELFQKEQAALLNDLYEIPQRSCDRKVCCAGWVL